MPALVIRQDHEGCATLILNRPDKLNALTVPLFLELDRHLADLETQLDRVGVVIVRGAGKCFSAGNDLTTIGDPSPEPFLQSRVIERLANLPQPVVTAVHGHCYTGALELALAGDLLMASESAKFADTHGKWGLSPKWGMSQRLPRRIGAMRAKEMMFTSRVVSGREAAAIGLATVCVADDALDAEVAALASGIAGNSWFSHRANKSLVNGSDGLPIAAGLSFEVHRSPGLRPDARERMSKFGK